MAEVCVSTIECIEFPSAIPCSIDLIEPYILVDGQRVDTPLRFEAGERYLLTFLYKVGFPAANMFHMLFYRTAEAVQQVALGEVNPMTHQITPNPPILYAFQPLTPVAEATGILEQAGVINLTMPDMADDIYYGILAMSHP